MGLKVNKKGTEFKLLITKLRSGDAYYFPLSQVGSEIKQMVGFAVFLKRDTGMAEASTKGA